MFKLLTHQRGKRLLAVSIAAGMILLLTVLAACGNNSGGTTTGSGGTGSTPAPSPTAPLKVQNCGVLHSMRLLIVPADQSRVEGVVNCFWQDYQQCHPATMTYFQTSLDSGTIHNFAVKSANGQCAIIDGVQHFVVPHPPISTTVYPCASMAKQSDGLHIMTCGTIGNVFIPIGATQ